MPLVSTRRARGWADESGAPTRGTDKADLPADDLPDQNRSAFITFVQAATKSRTNFS
jgi:hypothetical protein